MISKSIENARTKVEGHNFDLRKHVVEYDDVMNKHREVIYAIRRRILEGENLHERMLEIIEGQIGVAIAAHSAGDDIDDNQIIRAYRAIVPMSTLRSQDISGLSTDAIEEKLIDDALAHYDAKERETGEEMTRYLERAVMLSVIDKLWREHLTIMDDMRQGIGLQAYAQKDPLVAYKTEGFEMFEQLLANIDYDTGHKIFFANIQRAPVLAQPRNLTTNQPIEGNAPAAKKRQKIGRNDPCWCGSGKKFKNCHGAPAAQRVG
jgi:preprotein translocase subunit SecA